jgi:hypothetical protein
MAASRPAVGPIICLRYGTSRLAGVEHCVDANVGLHFAHVDKLDLLTAHFGADLVVVEHVAQEWLRRATKTLARPVATATDAARAAYQTDLLVRDAARKLMVAQSRYAGTTTEHYTCSLGTPVELDQDCEATLAGLREALMELAQLDPDSEHPRSNYGECACIAYVRIGLGVRAPAHGVLLSNDRSAVNFAHLRGVRYRTTRQILDQIVAEGRLGLTATEGDELFTRMRDVSEVTPDLR